MMDRPPIEAVVFDLDGTLVDTIEDIAAALNHELARRGAATHDLPAYRLMIGEGARKLVERALGPRRGDEIDQCLEGFRRRYEEHLVVQTRLYPGIAGLLDGLTARALPMSVVSNKPDGLTRQVVDRLLPRWRWTSVSGQRDGTPRKPDPAMAVEAAAAMGVRPGRCLFVGDSKVDMQTATAAGMIPIGVAWGFRDREELTRHGATCVVEEADEILGLLGGDGEGGV